MDLYIKTTTNKPVQVGVKDLSNLFIAVSFLLRPFADLIIAQGYVTKKKAIIFMGLFAGIGCFYFELRNQRVHGFSLRVGRWLPSYIRRQLEKNISPGLFNFNLKAALKERYFQVTLMVISPELSRPL